MIIVNNNDDDANGNDSDHNDNDANNDDGSTANYQSDENDCMNVDSQFCVYIFCFFLKNTLCANSHFSAWKTKTNTKQNQNTKNKTKNKTHNWDGFEKNHRMDESNAANVNRVPCIDLTKDDSSNENYLNLSLCAVELGSQSMIPPVPELEDVPVTP